MSPPTPVQVTVILVIIIFIVIDIFDVIDIVLMYAQVRRCHLEIVSVIDSLVSHSNQIIIQNGMMDSKWIYFQTLLIEPIDL